MCGIAGILMTGGRPVEESYLGILAAAIAHRGPDGEGIWISSDRSAGLVHRRLAIIDPTEDGRQPMLSGDGRYVIVFNGEIYNFLELRQKLIGMGSRFLTESDTEVILEAWRHWGAGMLQRFNGMWALAIFDSQTSELFLARDRFGIKPLLYSVSPSGFTFASEMRALCALPAINRRLEENVAARLLFDPFSIEGSERTLIGAVRRLPAGHFAIWKRGNLGVTRWWRTTDHLVSVPVSAGERADHFRELFLDSVRLRLRSDVPIGSCLSGGFDSTAVVSAMAQVAGAHDDRAAGDWRHAFVASFPGKSNDETPQALEAAQYAKVTPHVLNLESSDALEQIDTVLRDLDEIYIGLPTAPWQIYGELRRAKIVVSLDGHGADELMGGYRQIGQTLGFVMRNQFSRFTSTSTAMARAGESAKAAWLSSRGLNFLRGHAFMAPRPMDIPSDVDEMPGEWGALNVRLYRMFHGTVLPTILRNFDRLSMAHGVEVRMPFMDWRLVTYTMSLPDVSKASGGYSKVVARQAMAGAMPESIRTARRKVGFNSPMPEWLNGSLGTWAQKVLAVHNDEFSRLVHVDRLRERVRALTSQRRWDWHNSGRLWPYIHLNWMLSRQ